VRTGQLGLDDPIQTWTPQVPNARHITVRELLNNTSGIFDYLDDPQWQQQVAKGIVRQNGGLVYRQHWLPQQLVRFATRHKPYFPPGTGYHYSNTNSILLGMILEKVTGRPVEELLRARILRLLRLQHTLLPTSGALPSPHL
jgi:D-alanyl-D-alanine carboxypeptidase